MPRLPRTVVALGVVSLLTDLSSEMIVPLLPAFLTTLGASGALIGLLDGVAETTSAWLKLVSGTWADRAARRKPLVVAGYALASAARPLMALITAPWQAVLVRFADRVGKGLRSSPRDALIADAAPADRRGAAFGFHRGMDHAGALAGPLVAYALITWAGASPRLVFALAALPAAVAVLTLIVFVREHPHARPAPVARSPRGAAAEATPLPRAFWSYLVVVALFTLSASSDLFLLLRAHELGVPAAHALLLWALLHLVRSTLSAPLGALSDRLSRRRLIGLGWLIYAATYLGFAAASVAWHAWALFAVYGLYSAAVEGAEKALVADLAPASARGRAFGWFHFVVGACALPASLGFGLIWDHASHATAFVVAAALAATAALGLALFTPRARSAG